MEHLHCQCPQMVSCQCPQMEAKIMIECIHQKFCSFFLLLGIFYIPRACSTKLHDPIANLHHLCVMKFLVSALNLRARLRIALLVLPEYLTLRQCVHALNAL